MYSIQMHVVMIPDTVAPNYEVTACGNCSVRLLDAVLGQSIRRRECELLRGTKSFLNHDNNRNSARRLYKRALLRAPRVGFVLVESHPPAAAWRRMATNARHMLKLPKFRLSRDRASQQDREVNMFNTMNISLTTTPAMSVRLVYVHVCETRVRPCV
jgi:hypothetical protein